MNEYEAYQTARVEGFIPADQSFEEYLLAETNENCTDPRATVFDKHGSGIGGWIDCSQQRGSKSIDSSNWCCACFKYYTEGEEE